MNLLGAGLAMADADEAAGRLRVAGWELREEAIGAAPPLVWLVRGERGGCRIEGLGLSRDEAWSLAWRAAGRDDPAGGNG